MIGELAWRADRDNWQNDYVKFFWLATFANGPTETIALNKLSDPFVGVKRVVTTATQKHTFV